MPPKKRAAAASKKPPASQPSQPAKFGILHFFEKQTQASQTAKRQNPDPDPVPPPPPPPLPPLAEEEPSEVSPEVTKTLAPKRVKFSPGMVSASLLCVWSGLVTALAAVRMDSYALSGAGLLVRFS
jgi:DNA replication ATP-dependent helicase Dna2